MLSDAIIKQLQQHFGDLEKDISFVFDQSSDPKQAELLEMLEGVSSTSGRMFLRPSGEKSDIPGFRIEADGQDTGIVFRGIPGGHEFTSLILAVLHSSGKGKWPDEVLQNRVKALKTGGATVKLRTFISLSCTNCPDVVQALNQMSLLHPDIQHCMIDGAFAQDEISRLGIQGVPAVFIGDDLIHSGRAGFAELLEALEGKLGSDASAIEAVEHPPVDIAVIGAGPAGCAAAIYSARKGLNVALIAGRVGGQVNDTAEIANLISVPSTSGTQLSADLRRHAEQYSLSIYENRKVSALQPAGESSGEGTNALHTVIADSGETFRARQIIVATGASWRKLGIPGEDAYLGRGVAFCPHCDGPFFKGKHVAVIGGGNSGIEAAIDLAGICSQVTVLEFADQLKADEVLIDKMNSLGNVSAICSARTTEIRGDGSAVTGVSYEERESGQMREVGLDGVFVQIGLVPNSSAFADVLATNRFGEIEVDAKGRSSVAGIYAAGDVSTTAYKQIVIAMGSGANASLAAFEDAMRGVIASPAAASV